MEELSDQKVLWIVLSSSIVDMEKATVKLMSAWFRRLVAGCIRILGIRILLVLLVLVVLLVRASAETTGLAVIRQF